MHVFQATSATLSFDNKGEINDAEAPLPCQSHNLKQVVHYVRLTETSLNSKVPRKVSWNSKRMPREQFEPSHTYQKEKTLNESFHVARDMTAATAIVTVKIH
jgi:hypothetical protein